MEDYLLTNRVNGPKFERYYQMMLAAGRTEKEAETVRDFFLAKEGYLGASFRQWMNHMKMQMLSFLTV